MAVFTDSLGFSLDIANSTTRFITLLEQENDINILGVGIEPTTNKM